ncbi:MAG: TlpA disulfide reductase family protein, partial [Daejeonella sp.]|nr:TlpA disulfide reductase family protein [Daejeonella sp.]
MKKTIQFIVLAALCFFLSSAARAQTTALKIGDQVPDISINNIINYKSSSVKLSDFKGKLLILDFWATWCGACLNAMPLTDSLQQAFDGKIQFFPVTYQTEKEVRQTIQKIEQSKGIRIFTALENKELSRLFPHTTLPHYVWIGPDGTLKAITGTEALNAENIRALLSQNEVMLREKKDIRIPYNTKEPLFVNNNGGDGLNIQYRTVFSGYVEGLRSGTNSYKADTGSTFRMTTLNQPLINLYRLAYSDQGFLPTNRIVVSVADSTLIKSRKTGAEYLDWLKDRGYCYELTVPLSMEKQVFEIMQADMRRLFPQYSANMKEQDSPCLALVRTSLTDKLKSKGGRSYTEFNAFGCTLQNFPLQRLIDQLNVRYMQGIPTPVVDQTGYTEWVDLQINAPLNSIVEMNRELARYDLQLVEKIIPVEKLVIRD